eukprot:11979736-Alexandrium_andersonii.AAC.1
MFEEQPDLLEDSLEDAMPKQKAAEILRARNPGKAVKTSDVAKFAREFKGSRTAQKKHGFTDEAMRGKGSGMKQLADALVDSGIDVETAPDP